MNKWADRAIEESKKKKQSEPNQKPTAVSSPLRGQNQDQSGYNAKNNVADYTISDETIHEVIAGVGAIRSTPVTMQSTPRGKKEANAPSSAARLQRAADKRRAQLDKFAQQEKQHNQDERQRQQQKRQQMAENYEVKNHPVHGKVLSKNGQTVTTDYSTADELAANHNGTLVKSLHPKKYHVKVSETHPVGPIKEETKLTPFKYFAEDADFDKFVSQQSGYKRGQDVKVGQKFSFNGKTDSAKAGEGPYQVYQRLKSQDSKPAVPATKPSDTGPSPTPKAPEAPKAPTTATSTPTAPSAKLSDRTSGVSSNKEFNRDWAKVSKDMRDKEQQYRGSISPVNMNKNKPETGGAAPKAPEPSQPRDSSPSTPAPKANDFDAMDKAGDWAMSTKDAKLKQDIGNRYQKTGGYTVTKSVQPSTDSAIDLIKKGAAAVSGAASSANDWLDKNVRKPLVDKGIIPKSSLSTEETEMTTSEDRIARLSAFIAEEEKKKRGRPPKAKTDTGEEAAEKRHSLVAQFRDRRADASGHYTVDVDGSSHRVHTSHAQRFLNAHANAKTADQKDSVESKFKSEIKGRK